ncbi:UDP-N-acetylmuramate dehydrogenase [Fodinicurvata sp. EGI_FJ10296]|uniref:UDP-N-acetylmuramate dehydrogenase n=1 Tax=Fodinicurvata sp. EGI_FJ10296 TaxID=3231908 RepID=UPI0034556A16
MSEHASRPPTPRKGPTELPSVTEDFRLDGCNTFGLRATSRYAVAVDSEDALAAVLTDPVHGGLDRRVIGGGSNVILRERYDGLTVLMRVRGRRLIDERPDAWIVEAAAGEDWHDFVGWTVAAGYPGLENLALIPGTVGAAPVQNIGAYGVELADRFDSLRAYDRETGDFVRMDHAECRFAYRDSVFKHQPDRYVVTAVRVRLPRPWQPVTTYADLRARFAGGGADDPSPREIFDAVVAVRRSKLPDPAVLGNAGSFFQNPVVDAAAFDRLVAQWPDISGHRQADGRVKLSAAWLIDRCGFKGARSGPVGVFDRHALVLVNHGGAAFSDVMALADRIVAAVCDRFGIVLVREPLVL